MVLRARTQADGGCVESVWEVCGNSSSIFARYQEHTYTPWKTARSERGDHEWLVSLTEIEADVIHKIV